MLKRFAFKLRYRYQKRTFKRYGYGTDLLPVRPFKRCRLSAMNRQGEGELRALAKDDDASTEDFCNAIRVHLGTRYAPDVDSLCQGILKGLICPTVGDLKSPDLITRNAVVDMLKNYNLSEGWLPRLENWLGHNFKRLSSLPLSQCGTGSQSGGTAAQVPWMTTRTTSFRGPTQRSSF